MKKSIKALIVEDELLIAETIKIYLQERGHSVVGIAISYEEAVALIAETTPDIVLLDIRLYGKKSGIDVANYLRHATQKTPYIIISSQYDSGIIEKAMHAGALGYITKPISKETLWSSVELAVMKLHNAVLNDKYIDVKVSNGIHRIYIKNILLIKSDHVYVEIICYSSKLLCRYTLKEMLDMLAQPNFIQCHRSYIINIDKIQKYIAQKVWINGEMIPVSAKYKQDLLDVI